MTACAATTIALPPAPLDVRTALELDRELYERAQRLGEQGLRLAKEAGYAARTDRQL